MRTELGERLMLIRKRYIASGGPLFKVDMACLEAAIEDDDLAREIAGECHDKSHDIRWCPTCESRGNGIDAYRTMLLRIINEEDK